MIDLKIYYKGREQYFKAQALSKVDDDNEFSLSISEQSDVCNTFQEIFAKTLNLSYYQKASKFELEFEHRRLKGCVIKSFEWDYISSLVISFYADVIVFDDYPKEVTLQDDARFRMSDSIKKEYDESIKLAKGDQSMISQITEELDLYLYHYDEFFDKKMKGEIVYL
jgi:hypothetical protein